VDFEGRFGIVTGGASGIGRATVTMLVERGARVLAVDLDAEGLESLTLELGGDRVVAFAADVADPKQVEGYAAAAMDAFGRIDVFFNNAGIAGPFKEVHDIELDEWHRTIDVNLHGVFYGMKYVVGHMRADGGGSIVLTGSNLSLFGASTRVDYTASKHGILGIARAVATEAGGDGVRVNVICPGPIDTPMLHEVEKFLNPEAPEVIRAAYEAISPMNRYATPDEIAEVVCFLLSSRSSFVSGIPMAVDGGFSAF
jgi:NAD(P)-dependent dehydrogenase (short-subunit alcohol dehydrogenase family)